MAGKPPKTPRPLLAENERLTSEVEELRLRLEEAEQALEAIRTGEADSLIVEGPHGTRVFSLEGADHSYRLLVEAMNEGAATLGEDGAILYCNKRFAEMLGSPIERIMGSAIFRFLTDRSRETFEAMVREANGSESRGEVELLGQDGNVVPAYLSMSVIHDEGSRRLCVVATDLRSQKRNEEIVADEQLARSVIDQAAEAIVVCDEHGRIIRASAAAGRLCGTNPLLVMFDEVFALELSTQDGRLSDLGEFHESSFVEAVLRGWEAHAAPAALRRQDGTTAHLLLSASSLRGEGDRVCGCVINLVDITERRRAEEALKQLNVQLAEADRRKNDFLAVLSHELRNPLAPIANSLAILNHAPPGGVQAELARQVIGRQVTQLSNLVNDLLDVTRITHNKVQLQKERLELNALVGRSVEDSRSLFEQAGVRLELLPGARPVPVHADSTRISQIVGNLLQNSAKFTSEGGQTRVSVAVEGGEAVVRVADDGVGMSRETLDRLFHPFSQAEQTLDRSKGGLGLGLALVKGLAELHGGSVSAHSDGLGRGVEMIVRLTLDSGAALEAAAPRTHLARVGRRVLIIEDNVDAADTLSEILAFDGHEVAVAYAGPAGIAKAREFHPEVVLCDIGLPGMDGYDVARAFRSDEALKGTYLVALTGYGRPTDLQRAQEVGFDRHLLKPPSLDKLEKLLAEMPPIPTGIVARNSVPAAV